MIGIDFDGIFVEDIEAKRYDTDSLYIEAISNAKIKTISEHIQLHMQSNKWIIVTGRKQKHILAKDLFSKFSKNQLSPDILLNFRGVEMNNTKHGTIKFKQNVCKLFSLDLFIDSCSYQQEKINTFIKNNYENK